MTTTLVVIAIFMTVIYRDNGVCGNVDDGHRDDGAGNIDEVFEFDSCAHHGIFQTVGHISNRF